MVGKKEKPEDLELFDFKNYYEYLKIQYND